MAVAFYASVLDTIDGVMPFKLVSHFSFMQKYVHFTITVQYYWNKMHKLWWLGIRCATLPKWH